MNNSAKFYSILAAVVLAVVVPSVLLLGGYGLLLSASIGSGILSGPTDPDPEPEDE